MELKSSSFVCRKSGVPTYRAGKVAFSLVVSHVVCGPGSVPAYVYFLIEVLGRKEEHACLV